MLTWMNQNSGLLAALAGILALVAVFLLKAGQSAQLRRLNERLRRENARLLEEIQRESDLFSKASEAMETRQERLRTSLDERMEAVRLSSENSANELRRTLDQRLDSLTRSNAQSLQEMRKTVDERLATTLEGKLGESFKLVNDQLSRVHKGLGEMQNLASSVGDLKKVLTNVKTRGVWGEVRLRALFEQNLAPGQYEENAQIVPGSQERVEFAVRIPSAEGEGALLPVDSKFPQEDYLRLVDASQAGDAQGVAKARQALERAILEQAKKIAEKYICPPGTTDFAVLFLPVESLYAEAISLPGLTDKLQTRFRVMLAGPSTFSALLTSLQMGLRTCALEKRSGEILKLLEGVKQEFQKFGETIVRARLKLEQAGNELDNVDTRTRAINRRLRDIGEE
ncbi:MAG TPA: DNA recombination protein RmuC [Candidatus Pullichristensenella excrementigallinarum]|uniref:DNA recombination protein RmuC n=1 Tax=Candidatus Pullichristensenella excrementigallinarum TaxID=2840907 RepID=A0A9D1ICC7_9FIRM|nr:DNA recombination protein RmuC [Candidatus Pullichristensenella excrementigallinarum]